MLSVRVQHLTVVSIGLWLMVSGCAATLAEPAYAEVEYVPAGIYTYPYTIYDGQRVYFVDGHWYYLRGRTWVYFYREPEPLRRYRVEHYSAPRAYSWPSHRYEAPPAHRYVAPPAYAPHDHRDDRRSAPPARRTDRDRKRVSVHPRENR